jgi:biotin transport system substrate-specific component
MTAARSDASTLAGALWPSDIGPALRTVVLVVAGVAAMTLAAKVKVPAFPVPVTLQTLAVPLLAAGYGARLGTATMVAYLAAGFLGLPVFTNTPPAAAGPLYFLGPTGGYLLAYPLAAFLVGAMAESGGGRALRHLVLAMLLGAVVVYAFGFAWLAAVAHLSSGQTGLGMSAAWAVGVEPFLLAEIVKIALAACLVRLGWTAVETTLRA